MGRLIERLVRWFIFSVTIALLPLMFNYFRLLGRGENPDMNLVVSRGELLIVSAAIAAGAVGELIASGRALAIPKLISGGGCILILFLASLWFADISVAAISGQVIDARTVSVYSMYIFAFTVVSSGSSLVLAGISE